MKYLAPLLGASALAAAACASGSDVSDFGAGGAPTSETTSSTGASGDTSRGATGGTTTSHGATNGSSGAGAGHGEGGAGSGGGPCSGPQCDEDGDGVTDGTDTCPATPSGEAVNHVGCSESQLQPTLDDTFPPYGLTWTPTGDVGRAGGLTWTYTGIDRADLFHIYWVPCDDPTATCGVSLDGPIDAPGEA
ncbi:MAG TPA: hypothetical protein VGM56_03970, partial [Byssovorax sp.]